MEFQSSLTNNWGEFSFPKFNTILDEIIRNIADKSCTLYKQ